MFKCVQGCSHVSPLSCREFPQSDIHPPCLSHSCLQHAVSSFLSCERQQRGKEMLIGKQNIWTVRKSWELKSFLLTFRGIFFFVNIELKNFHFRLEKRKTSCSEEVSRDLIYNSDSYSAQLWFTMRPAPTRVAKRDNWHNAIIPRPPLRWIMNYDLLSTHIGLPCSSLAVGSLPFWLLPISLLR